MKVAWVLAIVAGATLAGCAGVESANPSLAAPKLVVAARADGNATVFIHSAFGEREYDWIHVRLDNETRANRTSAFSLEENVPAGFYLDASAQAGDAVYVLRARIDVFGAADAASVAFVGLNEQWSPEPESFDLPFERLLERRSPR